MNNKTQLAILGGEPVRTKPFPRYNTIGNEEKRAVNEVMDSGNLSQFLGTWSDDFYGGPRVRKLEREWAEYFGVRHALTARPGPHVRVTPSPLARSRVGFKQKEEMHMADGISMELP